MPTPETEQLLRLLCTCAPENILLAEQLAQSVSINIPELLDAEGLTGLGLFNLKSFRKEFLEKLTLYKSKGLKALKYFPSAQELSVYLGASETQHLNGIEALKNLKHLYCNNINVFDLSALAGLERLESAYFFHTKVADLSPLAGLLALKNINCQGTKTQSLAPLAGLVNLEYLHFAQTQVSDLSPISNLYQLGEIDLSNTQVTDLEPLKKLKNLHTLDFENTQISDLSPLFELPKLRYMNCRHTPIPESQIADFSKTYPDCQIFSGSEPLSY